MSIFILTTGAQNATNIGDMSILRIARTVRMLRISRMARILRAVPELLILLKGVKAASRSVFVFFTLWLIIIYIYALMFRQICESQTECSGSTTGYFSSVL